MEVTTNGLIYVTLSHGGLIVLRANGPIGEMTHLHTYHTHAVPGTGGLWAKELPDGTLIAEYGTKEGHEAFDPDNEAPDYIHKFDTVAAANGDFSYVESAVIPGLDSHGTAFCEQSDGNLILMVTNRLSADLVYLDISTMTVLGSQSLLTETYFDVATDYAYYYEDRLYVAFRGPKPLSALTISNENWVSGTAIYKGNCSYGIVISKIIVGPTRMIFPAKFS